MTSNPISGGTAHALPADLRKVLLADKAALEKWEDITPLARNEWICWVESVKKAETRQEHVDRVCPQLKEGKRRPCCWMGCIHRKDKPMSRTQKWILERRGGEEIGGDAVTDHAAFSGFIHVSPQQWPSGS